jgi:hypothetical protein
LSAARVRAATQRSTPTEVEWRTFYPEDPPPRAQRSHPPLAGLGGELERAPSTPTRTLAPAGWSEPNQPRKTCSRGGPLLAHDLVIPHPSSPFESIWLFSCECCSLNTNVIDPHPGSKLPYAF